jgi:hypothetical protein
LDVKSGTLPDLMKCGTLNESDVRRKNGSYLKQACQVRCENLMARGREYHCSSRRFNARGSTDLCLKKAGILRKCFCARNLEARGGIEPPNKGCRPFGVLQAKSLQPVCGFVSGLPVVFAALLNPFTASDGRGCSYPFIASGWFLRRRECTGLRCET